MIYHAHKLTGIALLASLMILTGCKSASKSSPTQAQSEVAQPASDDQVTADATQAGPTPLWSLQYPASKEAFAGDLDITVIQDRKTLKITNHTVTSYHNVQIWVNQRYVIRAADVPVGQTTSILLKSLMNQYGEKYPTPGLFRPDRSFPALLVEMVLPDQNKRYRLIVQKTHSQF